MNTVLMVYPHRDCEVTPVSLHSIKETKVNLAFNHYKENTKSEFFATHYANENPIFLTFTSDKMVGPGSALINQFFLWPLSCDSIVSKVSNKFKCLVLCTCVLFFIQTW